MSAQFLSPFFIPKDGRKLLQLSRHMSSGLLQMHCFGDQGVHGTMHNLIEASSLLPPSN